MVRLCIFIILCLCLYILFHSRWFRLLRQMWREADLGSQKEGLTMFDVRRLLVKGEKDLAVRVYCELFKTNTQEASIAIDEIERSIQHKDFEF